MKYYRCKLLNNDVNDITATLEVEQRLDGIVRVEKRKVSFVSETEAIRRGLSIITGHIVVSYKVIKFPDEIV